MITVSRTLDVGLCLDILTDEDIFKVISEDTATFENLKVDVINDIWLGIYFGDEVIGCMQLKPKYNKCYESHIHILPEHRKEHSITSGKCILEWCKKEISGSVLYTEVSSIYKNVISYLEYFEFSHIGTIKNAFFKNGIQNDIIIMSKAV